MSISTNSLSTNINASNSIITNAHSTTSTMDNFPVDSVSNAPRKKMTTSYQAASSLTTSTESVLLSLSKSKTTSKLSQTASQTVIKQNPSYSITASSKAVTNDDSDNHHLGRKLLGLILEAKPTPQSSNPNLSCEQNAIPMFIELTTDWDITRMSSECTWDNKDSQNSYTGFNFDPLADYTYYRAGAVRHVPNGATNLQCTTTINLREGSMNLRANLQKTGRCGRYILETSYNDSILSSALYCRFENNSPDLPIANAIYQDCKGSKPMSIWVELQKCTYRSVDLICNWDECNTEPACGGLAKSARSKTVRIHSEDVGCVNMQIPRGARALQCELIAQQPRSRKKIIVPIQIREKSRVANANGECNTLFVETQGTKASTRATCFPEKYTTDDSATACEKAVNRDCVASQQTDIWMDIQTNSPKSAQVDIKCKWDICQPIGAESTEDLSSSKTITLAPTFGVNDFCIDFSVPKGIENLQCDMTVHRHGTHAQQKITINPPKRDRGILNPRGECNTLFIQSTIKETARRTAASTHTSCYPETDFSGDSTQPNTRCAQTIPPEEYAILHSDIAKSI